MFQSASRSEERDDGSARSRRPWHGCFNPRPAPKSGTIETIKNLVIEETFQSASRSEERDDILQTLDARYFPNVSIRVPLRRAGRCAV